MACLLKWYGMEKQSKYWGTNFLKITECNWYAILLGHLWRYEEKIAALFLINVHNVTLWRWMCNISYPIYGAVFATGTFKSWTKSKVSQTKIESYLRILTRKTTLNIFQMFISTQCNLCQSHERFKLLKLYKCILFLFCCLSLKEFQAKYCTLF